MKMFPFGLLLLAAAAHAETVGLEKMLGWLGVDAPPPTIFADASVQGPDSRFRTVVLSGEASFLFAQYRADGSTTYAGVDRHGGWHYDPATGRFSDLDAATVAFLEAHDFHRTVLAPLSRYSIAEENTGSDDLISLSDVAGGTIDLHIDAEGQPKFLLYPDHRSGGQVRVQPGAWFKRNGMKLFRRLEITQGDQTYLYEYDRIAVDLAPMLSPASPGHTADEIALGRLHHLDQLAHLAGDAALFTAHFAAAIIDINGGRVREIRRDEARARFQDYFDGVTFQQWRDREPARIVLRGDGSHADKIVEKEVVMKTAPEAPVRFAWLESWSKDDEGAWRLTLVVSTRQ